MFKALRAWTLQCETYTDINSFFNPRLNPLFGLNMGPTFRSLIPGLQKIFNRDVWIWYHRNSAPLIYQLFKKAVDDPEIHILVLLGLQAQVADFPRDFNDDDEDGDEPQSGYGLCLDIDLPVGLYTDTINYTYASAQFDLDEHSQETIIEQALVTLRQWSQQVIAIPEEQHNRTMRCPDSVIIRNPLFYFMFRYHFGKAEYTKTFRYEDGHMTEDGAYNLMHILSYFEEGQKIEVTEPFSYEPRLRWITSLSTSDRSRLHRILNYSTNVAQLTGGAMREDNELSSNLYGVELEVSSDLEPKDIVDATDKLFCACKNDTSITGSKRFRYEIVTRPCPIKSQKKNWAQILGLGYDKFDVTRSTTNGMHVHVDMDAFKNKDGLQDGLHQRHFMWFFCNPVNRAFMELISERDAHSLTQYAMPPNFPKNLSLGTLHRSLHSYIHRPFRGIIALKEGQSGRIVTIEVRLFKGIVSLASICKNLEFVDSVFQFTTKVNFQSNSVQNYLDWLNSIPKNRYSTLREYLGRFELDEVLDKARFRQLLHGQTDCDKVKALLSRLNYPLTASHIEIINSIVEGAKFALNRKGELVIVETNRSRIYDLDSILHSRLRREPQANVSNPGSRSRDSITL